MVASQINEAPGARKPQPDVDNRSPHLKEALKGVEAGRRVGDPRQREREQHRRQDENRRWVHRDRVDRPSAGQTPARLEGGAPADLVQPRRRQHALGTRGMQRGRGVSNAGEVGRNRGSIGG